MRFFIGKVDPGLPTVEELRGQILQEVTSENAEIFQRLSKLSEKTEQLSTVIKDLLEERTKLSGISPEKAPFLQDVEVETLVHRTRTNISRLSEIKQELAIYEENFLALQEERQKLLAHIKNELNKAYSNIQQQFQKKVDLHAESFLATLKGIEDLLEQARKYHEYVPVCSGGQDLQGKNPYYMFCPPLELWRFLKAEMRAVGGLS